MESASSFFQIRIERRSPISILDIGDPVGVLWKEKILWTIIEFLTCSLKCISIYLAKARTTQILGVCKGLRVETQRESERERERKKEKRVSLT